MPQYLISVWHDDTYETDFSTPDAQRRAAQAGAFNEELMKAGAWVFAAGLQPASSATVRPPPCWHCYSCSGPPSSSGVGAIAPRVRSGPGSR